ncbi:uncharacterized protein LOC131334672 isoform X2 [Rhododendron vialii]|uniref:uncharacterized protein LOC131334672 isoform X2 n=1 Tax=Rhododendron vialii TaxID=182163 RepID=UPI00265F830B|nr:uncharacterized protein LOC131334672 isoform X2 [Rhododendron vialii]
MEAGKSPDWLPVGWTEEVKVKGDRKYKCYIDPLTGRKFYSKPQVSDYLRTVQHNSSALQQEKMGTISVSQHNTSELIGGETYLKEEEPQDVKALKRTSYKSKLLQTGSSMLPVEEVFQPLASDVSGKVAGMSPDWLPAGWTEHVKDNNGRKVKCYIDPLTGRKFYSKPQVSDYLRTVQRNSSALQQEKTGTVTVSQSNVVELSGDTTTLKAKGSKFRTRSCSKQSEMGFSNESVEHNTSEFTGGETNLKEEELQNVKALKRTSCKSKLSQTCSSMQPVEEVFQPLASDVSVKVAGMSPDWLPAGWTEHVKDNNGRKVKCYVDPLTGRKFYSKPQVSEYLKTVKPNGSASQQNKNADACELTGGKTTLKPTGSQFRTRSSKQIDMGFSIESAEKLKMDELNGGKTSLKEEKSHNDKTLKQTSCKSERKQTAKVYSTNKVAIESVTPDGLPPGWRKEIKIQKKANGTRKDTYYTDPVSGYVFFSQPDALRYLKTGDVKSCSMKPKKRDELGFLDNGTLAKMGELGVATNSQKVEGSQNVKITKRKSHTSNRKPVGSAEQPVEKGVIESVATEGLPPGWLQETYYTDPASGYVFFSLEDALRYLETGDFDKCTVKPKKRDMLGFFNEDTSPNVSGLTRVKNSLKQEGSQNGATPKATRRVTKQREMGFSKASIEKSNMDEITGGRTSLKQEGSQNVKTPKSTSRLSKQKINGHSKHSVENEMIERVTPDGLPPEWIKEVRIQKKANGTRKDTYYTDPVSGYVFLSQKDALRYLKSGDIRTCAKRPKKRDELGFLNEASSVSLPSVAATQKIGNHTPKRRLFAEFTAAGTENDDTRILETADAGGPRKRQRILEGELSPGTQNRFSRSLETADAGGPQKRQCTRKEKLSPGNAIEEGADKKESYDPTSSPPPITKGSKRKQGKRVRTGNSTVSKKKDKSTNSEATNKSNRKLETGASRSKRKKAVGVPSRSSSRLMRPKSKMVKSLEFAQEGERLRAEAERTRAEGEELVRETEAAERAQVDVAWARESAMAQAKARAQVTRAKFVAETYTPPESHVFVPSGFVRYVPHREDYNPELVLRDPEVHLSTTWSERRVATSRGHGGAANSLALYRGLPERVRRLVDEAGFGQFIPTLMQTKNDHAVLTALAERWQDTSNTFHFPVGEMTVTPLDFAAITGLRVGGEPIPFDTGIYRDEAALRWFLGRVPDRDGEMVKYEQFREYLKKIPTTQQEEEQMARAYLLYLFGASLYPNRRSKVHLSYLPALRDLSTASRFDWGGAALGTCYGFMGDFTRIKKAVAGYWRVWELWAYEVLKMYPPENKCPDLRTLPRALIWGPPHRGQKKSKGSLQAFRVYLDELSSTQIEWNPWGGAVPEPEYVARSRVVTASRVLLESAFGWQWYLGDRVTRQSLGLSEFQVPGPLPPHASHTDSYTLAELQRFTTPATDLAAFLRPECDYAVYRRQYLAGPLGVLTHRAVVSEVLEAGLEHRGASSRPRGETPRSRERTSYAAVGGLPRLSWTLAVRDAQGEAATIQFEAARTEPAQITGPVPVEWVEEAVRLMLAMEKEFHKIAGGTPLQLHYPPAVTPAPTPASSRPHTQGRAAPRRKTVWGPPSKKATTGTSTTPAAAKRQTSTSRPAASVQRAVESAVRVEERYQMKLRERPRQQEPAQKKRKETTPQILESESEEEEEENEECLPFSSNSDDSADDPGYKRDSIELEDDEDEDDDDDDFYE